MVETERKIGRKPSYVVLKNMISCGEKKTNPLNSSFSTYVWFVEHGVPQDPAVDDHSTMFSVFHLPHWDIPTFWKQHVYVAYIYLP